MKAIILAGGRGERLRPLTDSKPKSLVSINGKPLLEYQIASLRRSGITDILLVVGYLGSLIKEHFGDGSRHGVRLQYFAESRPLGTAGALAMLRGQLPECFLILYGDLMLDVDFERLIRFHYSHSGIYSIAVHPNDHPSDSDIIVADSDGMVTKILPKRERRDNYYSNCVNAGIMVCSREATAPLRVGEPQDIEVHVLGEAIRIGGVHVYPTSEYIKDAGTPQRLAEATRSVMAGTVERRNLKQPQKAIFLDRDGTINDHVGFLVDPRQLKITEDVYAAIRAINESDYLAIIVSNQSGIARNLCTVNDLNRIHQRLEMMLGNRGAYVDKIYFCPHHEDGGFPGENKKYKLRCDCRKPKTGMLAKAARDYGIDLGASYIVGDTTVDVQTGKNAGLATILLQTGEGGRDGKYNVNPDFDADSLLEAVKFILSQKVAA